MLLVSSSSNSKIKCIRNIISKEVLQLHFKICQKYEQYICCKPENTVILLNLSCTKQILSDQTDSKLTIPLFVCKSVMANSEYLQTSSGFK